MPVPTTGESSFPVLRQEGHKTSWFTPNYPTVGTLYQTGRDFLLQADVNNMLGSDLDVGQFDFKQAYGWDTWSKPKIEWAYVHQFAEDGGIRLAWKVVGGDPWRTAWSIRFLTTGYPTAAVGSDSGYDGQYGPEHNPSASDKSLQYSTDRKIQALQDSVNWDSLASFGDYQIAEQQPQAGGLIDPTATPQPNGVIFSYVIENTEGLTVDGSTPHYVSIVPVDGRQYDTLPSTESPSAYSLDRSRTDYSAGVIADAGMGTGWNYYDGDNGDGGLILFDNIGGANITSITNQGFTVEVDNKYKYYLGGPSLYYWVYVTTNLTDNGEPYWPDEANYSGPTGEDNFTTFDFDKWVRYEGVESIIDGVLTSSTEYHVYISAYRDSDLDRFDSLATPVSAPAKDRGYVAFDDNKTGSEQNVIEANPSITTASTSITQPTLSGQTVEWNSERGYIEFTYNGDEDGVKVFYKVNGGPQQQATVSCSNNIGTANSTKQVRWDMSQVQPQGTTIDVAVQMTSNSEGDSPPSPFETATEVGFSDIPICPI